jgi:tetratricopeptide (TPR) repeat protein
MALILDHMLAAGRMELDDGDAHELRDGWQQSRTAEERRTQFAPLEVACACGVMHKRTTEEGGGYRIPHQGLRELLLYERLCERDPGLGRESVRSWLLLPPLEELAGALARIAEDLWRAERVADMAPLAREQVGATALGRMLAGRLERAAVDEEFQRRLRGMLEALAEEPEAAGRVANLLLFAVPERLEGLAVTEQLLALWEAASPWLEARAERSPADYDPQRDVSVASSKLGDVYRALGQGEEALRFYQKALELRERLYRAEPQRADFARDLSVSYDKLGDVYRAVGQGEEALRFYQQALEIAERLYRAEPQRADFARDLSVSYNKLGDVYGALGQGEEALRFYQQALELRERLYRAEPQRADFTWDLVCSYVRQGQITGQRPWLEQARDLLRGLRRQNRLPHQQAAEWLDRLEDMLRHDTGSGEP